jgi:hypothetical protein
MLSFSLSFEKKNRSNIGQVRGHNTRLHPTKSQLPKSAWFDPDGQISVSEWDQKKLDVATDKKMAKRKDAVVGIEFIFQVGDQSDWRELPDAAHPHGKPKVGTHLKIIALAKAAQAAVEAEFGVGNVVSIDVHLDESTPHVHCVVTPIFQGKLQAKHWLDGASSCAALRRRMHQTFSIHLPAQYTPGAAGGLAHDASKGAGGEGGPKPKKPLLVAFKAAVGLPKILKGLKDEVGRLKRDLINLFQRLKRAELRTEKAVIAAAAASKEAAEAAAGKDSSHARAVTALRKEHESETVYLRSQLEESRADVDILGKRNNELLAKVKTDQDQNK